MSCNSTLNVRLELSDGVTEGDIVQDLFSNEKVLTLVDGIAKVGYLTHEIRGYSLPLAA